MGKDQVEIGINTVSKAKQNAMKKVLADKAPKRKQQTLIPKEKRVKRRLRKKDSDDGGEIGTKIEPVKMTLDSLPRFKREAFTHWKPWLQESNLPDWADKLHENTDLKTLLTKNSKEGEEALLAETMWWKR